MQIIGYPPKNDYQMDTFEKREQEVVFNLMEVSTFETPKLPQKESQIINSHSTPFAKLPPHIKNQILSSKKAIQNLKNRLEQRRLNKKYDQKIRSEINEIRPHLVNVEILSKIRFYFNNITKIDLRRPFQQLSSSNFQQESENSEEFEEGVLECLSQFEKLQIVYLPKEVVVRQFFKRKFGKKSSKVECTVKGNIPVVVIHELMRIWMNFRRIRKL